MELVIYNPTEDGFIQAIEFNHDDLKKELAIRLEKYNNLVYSESSIKEAKTDRASLNKLKDAIENKRKEIKKQCLKPYEDFEAKIKEIVAMIDKPITAIDTQVKNYEQIKKDEKLEGIKAFYADKVMDLADLVPFEKIFNPKWLNATYKEADIQKEISDLFVKVESDIQVIRELQTEYEKQVIITYLKGFDLTAALQEKKHQEEQAAKLAEYKRQQEEKKQQAQAEPEKQVKVIDGKDDNWNTLKPGDVVEFAEPAQEPIPEEKMYTIDFRVTATAVQLQALKQFFVDNNIKYGRTN